jgi:glutamine synthetase
MTPAEFFEFCRKHQVQMVDIKFVDMLGTWQHCSYHIRAVDEGIFQEGKGFDGSSMRGWQEAGRSDLMAVCDPSTATLDPFYAQPTVSLIADVVDPETRRPYTRDPRFVVRKAAAHLKETGIADTCCIGPEPEFFIFDRVRFRQGKNLGMYEIDSAEGSWNTDRFEEPNLGYKPGYKGGHYPVSPTDTYHDLRGEMVYELVRAGLVVEAHHHEVATGGQSEINLRYAELTRMADQFMWYKYIIRNVARRHGKTVTFMPKPIFEDNGSGMHTHLSLWKEGVPLFAGDRCAGLSELGLHAAGGILKHAPALLALGAPTTNSYRRLVPGHGAPVNLVLSARNRTAACRIPTYSRTPESRRVEFRCPDPTANGYLFWSALLMAALDGIQNRIDPGPPLDAEMDQMPQADLARLPKVPGSLAEAVNALEKDHTFLLRGGVFTKDLVDGWIRWKRDYEIDPVRLRPVPFEFHLYYDA